MKKRLLKIFPYLMLALFMGGCGYVNILMRNAGDSIFSEPIKVSKLDNPLRDSVKISVLWGGHSTSLVQMYDKVLIFDPFFSKRFGGVIMRRKELGLNVDSLKRLDYIFVSHSHMDHLNFTAISQLSEKFPKAKLVFPEGVENYMPGFDIDMIRLENRDAQLKDYIGRTVNIDDMKVTPVYAKHMGGRYGFDVYSWLEQGATGYVLEYKDAVVYFAGDTGYDDKAFKEIGKRFNIDVALIPVGPCRNCDSTGFWFHTTSLEALELFKDIRAKYMIPVHYGSAKYMSDANKPLDAMMKMLDDSTSVYNDLKPFVKPLKEGEQIYWTIDN